MSSTVNVNEKKPATEANAIAIHIMDGVVALSLFVASILLMTFGIWNLIILALFWIALSVFMLYLIYDNENTVIMPYIGFMKSFIGRSVLYAYLSFNFLGGGIGGIILGSLMLAAALAHVVVHFVAPFSYPNSWNMMKPNTATPNVPAAPAV